VLSGHSAVSWFWERLAPEWTGALTSFGSNPSDTISTSASINASDVIPFLYALASGGRRDRTEHPKQYSGSEEFDEHGMSAFAGRSLSQRYNSRNTFLDSLRQLSYNCCNFQLAYDGL
jgi:hypothetical protein